MAKSPVMNSCRVTIALTLGLAAVVSPARARSGRSEAAVQAVQQPAPPRPTPPTRDPNTPGFVAKKALPDGTVPPPDAEGNFTIGPTHPPAPEMTVQEGVPQGTVSTFTMSSADSRIYPGIAREPGTFGTVDPSAPAR